jgi:acryloyl-coenzyme A reductase
VGAPTFNAALRSLRLGGRLVVVGNVTPEKVSMNLGYLITHGLHVHGGSGATRRDMAEIFAMHAARPFRVPIDRVLSLAEADAAQRLVRAGGLSGRVVLVPDPAGA